MKYLVLLFTVCLASFSLSARELVLRYDYGVPIYSAAGSNSLGPFAINRVEIFDDNSLELSNAIVPLYFFGQSLQTPFVFMEAKQLSHFQIKTLGKLAVQLSGTVVASTLNRIHCEILPESLSYFDHLSIAGNWDASSQTFNSPLRLIHGPEGCWLKWLTHPKEKEDRVISEKLKYLIQILTR